MKTKNNFWYCRIMTFKSQLYKHFCVCKSYLKLKTLAKGMKIDINCLDNVTELRLMRLSENKPYRKIRKVISNPKKV